MVKHISLVYRPEGVTHEAFVDYWKNVHAELVKTALPGLRKYVGNFPVQTAGGPRMPGSGEYLSCDAVVELHFDDVASLQAAMASPGWLGDARKASSARLANLARHQFVVAEECVVPLP